jgi:hypothetical protein
MDLGLKVKGRCHCPHRILVGQDITNASGQYSIDSVPIAVNGEHVTMTASKAGYTTKSVDTTI